MSTILKALKHNFAVGDTSYTFNDSNITDNTIIDVYFTKDVSYECSQTGNTVTVEIPAQTSVVGCAIVINNVDSVDYPITAENVSYFDTSVYYELLEHKSELNGFTTAIGILDDTKQDTLTAGDNITIENNVISAIGGGSSYIDTSNILRTNSAITSGFEYTATENCVVCIEFRNVNYGGVNVLINNVQVLSTYSYSLPSGAFFNSVEMLNLKQGDTIKFNPNDTFAPTWVGIYGVH